MWISLRAVAFTGALPLACGACASTQAVAVKPFLPEPPASFGKPVPVPQAAAGQSARGYAAQAVGALVSANARLVNDAAFYRSLRK